MKLARCLRCESPFEYYTEIEKNHLQEGSTEDWRGAWEIHVSGKSRSDRMVFWSE